MFLREAMFKADCDRCGERFDPVKGGICTRCREALCGAHLHGSLLQRLKVDLLGRESVCTLCRARAGAPASPAAR